MAEVFDCIVVGVGGIGSAAFWRLAERGRKILGLEQFGVAHNRGSSHGETRIIRRAYFEHPDYVPLVNRSFELWADLEQRSGKQLYRETGLVLGGRAECEAVAGTQAAAERHGLSLDVLSPDDANDRFPGFRFYPEEIALFEPKAGVLAVEKCVAAAIDAGRQLGGELHTDEAVIDWTVTNDVVRVETNRGKYEAARLILTAGPWAGDVLRRAGFTLNVVRKVLQWHPVLSSGYNIDRGAPTFYFESELGSFYGMPSLDGREIKLAQHSGGTAVTDPLTVDRELHESDRKPVRAFVERSLRQVGAEPNRHAVCMYTKSADGHFIVDTHPAGSQVALCCGLSGHGFKFAPVLGEILADLVLDGTTNQPAAFLGRQRTGLQSG